MISYALRGYTCCSAHWHHFTEVISCSICNMRYSNPTPCGVGVGIPFIVKGKKDGMVFFLHRGSPLKYVAILAVV